eukprot:TRINITY_DN37059_c0_g1_i1.p1 TRINITY_DN37059_c0_g1~~TRINITY_DN37059_c0_g1_i1.p1  ORF type:complete len:314 (-),score=24.31 TRINITY_DN37059_c0_g1_i1:62-1003(-)
MRKIVAIMKCNSRSYPDGSVAIFQKMSTCQHSCEPNAKFTSHWVKGSGTLVALKALEAGEEVTISYVDTLWPTFFRKRQLRNTYFFDCKCHACFEKPDKTRTLPCHTCIPRTGGDPALLEYKYDDLIVKDGWINPSSGHDSAPWMCTKCSRYFDDPKVTEDTEIELMLNTIAVSATSDPERFSVVCDRHLMSNFVFNLRTLGPWHWATISLELALAKDLAKKVCTFPREDDVKELEENIDHFMTWAKFRNISATDYLGETLVAFARAMRIGGRWPKATEYYGMAKLWASHFCSPSSAVYRKIERGLRLSLKAH